jgi:hypothetical protein
MPPAVMFLPARSTGPFGSLRSKLQKHEGLNFPDDAPSVIALG